MYIIFLPSTCEVVGSDERLLKKILFINLKNVDEKQEKKER